MTDTYGSNVTVIRCPYSSTTTTVNDKTPQRSVVIDGVEYVNKDVTKEETQNVQFLNRDSSEICLNRDKNKCVFCDTTENLSVHHILERRLFTEPNEMGGYHPYHWASGYEYTMLMWLLLYL